MRTGDRTRSSPGRRTSATHFPVEPGLRSTGHGSPGGKTSVERTASPDEQRNSRFGLTFSVPASGQQSIKFVCSTGATTRRGNDFNTFNVTWQLVWF